MPTKVKGQNFKGLLGALRTLAHADAVERVLAEVRGESSNPLRYGGIVASGWYPVEWYAELHEAVGRALGEGPDFAEALGRQATVDDFRGVYRFVISLLSPGIVFAQCHRLMSLYFSGGTIEAKHAARSGTLVWRGWHGFSERIWRDCMGAAVQMLALSGANEIERDIRLTTGGAGRMELRWI